MIQRSLSVTFYLFSNQHLMMMSLCQKNLSCLLTSWKNWKWNLLLWENFSWIWNLGIIIARLTFLKWHCYIST